MASCIKRYHKDKVEVDGKLIDVTPEVAAVINRSDWNEAYQEKKRRAPVKRKDADGGTMDFDPLASSRECSLEAMMEAGAGESPASRTEGFEDEVVDRMETDARTRILCSLIPGLTKEEKQMLFTIMDDISSREYEKKYGVPRRTMLERRRRLLEDLRSRIEAEERSGSTLWSGREAVVDVRSLLESDGPER